MIFNNLQFASKMNSIAVYRQTWRTGEMLQNGLVAYVKRIIISCADSELPFHQLGRLKLYTYKAIFFLFLGLRILRPKFLHLRKKIKILFLTFFIFSDVKKLPDFKKKIKY